MKVIPLFPIVETMAPEVAFVAAEHRAPEKHDRIVVVRFDSDAIVRRNVAKRLRSRDQLGTQCQLVAVPAVKTANQ